MKSAVSAILLALAVLVTGASASVFLPKTMEVKTSPRSFQPPQSVASKKNMRLARRQRRSSGSTAMAIPGYGVAEQVFVGGFGNFLSIYNIIITARILLSWFPQAQGVAALQPVYAITDPYLNLFRGLIPPIFGLDLSPLLAFFLLSLMTNATAAVGCEIPPGMQQKFNNRPMPFGGRPRMPAFGRSSDKSTQPSMDY